MVPNCRAVSGGVGGMMQHPLRVLLVASHPVQYSSPNFCLYAQDPRLEILVAYCSLLEAKLHLDLEFGVEVKWDVPLLEGYRWIAVKNRSWHPGLGSFFGLFNPRIWSLIRRGNFDAVVLYTGYAYATFWMAIAAAKLSGVPILFGTDAHGLAPLDGKQWKVKAKKYVWPHLFRLADAVIVPSSATWKLMRLLGISEDRLALTPYCVDNRWWIEKSKQADRRGVRARWNIPPDAVVVLFCAKLQPWKRPQDLLRAFAKALAGTNGYLVFAGDGPLRPALEAETALLGISDRVRFIGFVNQSGLPEVYTAADLLVLPSGYEAFGVVVNEAMLCGCPVIVSDSVGAGLDLVREGETGFTFSTGDVEALCELLREALQSPERLKCIGEAARERMASWSPFQNLEGLAIALERAVQRHPYNRGRR
jgi:glycosyltransferase involved in cell wall biosynthesis